MTMASGSLEGSSLKALDADLIDAGNRLISLASSTDGLLALLERAESLLAKVEQQPSKRIRRALLPAMKALIADDLLHNRDLNIQVVVASCFNELTRISAPEHTYPDDLMKEVFRLYMISFKQLSCESSHNYSRALRILETVAKVKSSLMLVAMDSDGLVIEMFQIFLSNIRSKQQSDIFMFMEAIMTLVIEESDISIELLSPLLESVKMDDKATSPLSWELGRKVFENCAKRLHHCLGRAVKAVNLDFDDYAEIVASLCNNPSDRDSRLDRDSIPNSFETLNTSPQIVQSNMVSGAAAACGIQNKRRNPRKIAEDANATFRKTGVKRFREVSSDKYGENTDLALASEVGSARVTNDLSQKGCEGLYEVNLPRNEQILLSKPQHAKYLKKKKKQFPTDCGRELVGSRIKVWWPMDEMFYPGKVKAFDPGTKKHLVLYKSFFFPVP